MEDDVCSKRSHKIVATSGISRGKQDCNESEDEEDEDRDEPVTVATSVADSCSASHEFEWLSPGYQSANTNSGKHNGKINLYDVPEDPQQSTPLEESGVPSCQVSPARSAPHKQQKLAHVWTRKSTDIADSSRMSPVPCHELHSCHRHLSPMRSSWCCPSSPHNVCLQYHSGSMLSGLELLSFNRDCFGPDIPYWQCQNCSCLPPTGLTSQTRYHESHSWCRNASPHHEVMKRDSSSPCSTLKPGQVPGGSRQSRSARKRDCISPLSPRYSPVPGDRALRLSGHDQWQVPVHSEDIDNLHKVQELESDKKTLLFQASVLADQVDAQADKIIELERLLQQKKDELLHLEQNLHQEILGRSTMENNKLELMSELTNLRLCLTAAERDKKDSDDKCRKLEHQLCVLQTHLAEKEKEQKAWREKVIFNNSKANFNEKIDGSEMERLKSALDSVLIATDKDQKLEDLQSSLTKYKKLHDMILSSHTHLRKTAASGPDSHLFNLDESVICSVSEESLKKTYNETSSLKTLNVSQSVSSATTLPFFHGHTDQPHIPSSVTLSSALNSSFHKSNSVENICPISPYPIKNIYGTMPRQTGTQVLNQLQVRLQEHETGENENQSLSPSDKAVISGDSNNVSTKTSRNNITNSSNKSTGVSFGKGILKFRFGKRSSSETRLADECITIPTEKRNPEYSSDYSVIHSHSYLIKSDRDKNKGLLKFFSRFKRTGSQQMDGEFKRGGIRATAGPRLGWSHDVKIDPDVPFVQWNTDMVVDWFHKLGLTMYVNDCKRWMCNGEKLVKASSQDMEKELNMKHPLHRKKLLLAVKSLNSSLSNLPSSINKIDYEWVFRWLDDVGLPQYKDAFTESLIDGRMLNALTVDDLLYLKVTSQLHHVSIRCGIQVLREKGFDPHCLIRRSLPEESKVYTPDKVALWTNHRVMEWLRTVDLSEYAPNLRGSGVHGALIVYESKFNTNLFATLLNIPPTKTLLRRHLATHFKHIVGDELIQIKREKETEVPLSPSIKIKALKKSQFVLKKKRNKSDFDNEDYICPMDIPVSQEQMTQVPKVPDADKLIVRRNSDPSPQERNVDLKTMLQETSLSSVPSTIV